MLPPCPPYALTLTVPPACPLPARQAYLSSTAQLAMGGVLSASLKHKAAIAAYQKAASAPRPCACRPDPII